MRRSVGALVLGVVASVVASVPALARAQDALRISEAELAQKSSWGDKEGKTVVVEVKFEGYSNPNIYITRGARTKLRAGDDGKLASALPMWRTPSGQELDRKHKLSNVRVTGVARDDQNGERYVEVTDVVKLPDDVETFAAEAKKLGAYDDLLKLAERARKRADYYDDAQLRDWTLKCYEGALRSKGDALASQKDANYAKAAIELARQFKALANNANLGIALLNSVCSDAATTAADKEAAQKVLLEELEAAQYQGKWIPREEFKRSLGYVLVRDANGKGSWKRRERVEFEAEIANERPVLAQDPNPRKGIASFFEQAIQRGDLVKGMYKTEVVRTKGYGFPDFVDRVDDKAPSTLSWDQWILGDGVRLYFVNGVLYSIKTKADAWPTGDK